MNMSVDDLNNLSPDHAALELGKYCGSPMWVEKMVGARPFPSEDAIMKQAQQTWFAGSRAEWITAFNQYAETGTNTEIAAKITALEKDYKSRFGYAFVLEYTGKSPEEVLEIIKLRIKNNPYDEIKIATAEQNKIIRAGLKKMLS